MMIWNEAFDYLWAQLASGQDVNATRRLKDYQRKRLRRALLARSIKSYFLEASWVNTSAAAGSQFVAQTLPVTEPLIVLDGAIRTTDVGGANNEDNNNFELSMRRTAGEARVQVSRSFIKDEHLLSPAQAATKNIKASLGQGAMWPLTWPVPVRLRPNELLQITAKILAGGVPINETTFAQFRAVKTDERADDTDAFVSDLREYIAAHERQRPWYLSMYTPGFHSIAFPGTGLLQRTTAETQEAPEHLLVIGYASLFARDQNTTVSGTRANPKWRLSSSNGHNFSKEEIDIGTFAFAGPQYFWQALPLPFLLPKGSSLSASFSTLSAITGELERIENYVIFRCLTV